MASTAAHAVRLWWTYSAFGPFGVFTDQQSGRNFPPRWLADGPPFDNARPTQAAWLQRKRTAPFDKFSGMGIFVSVMARQGNKPVLTTPTRSHRQLTRGRPSLR